MSRTSTDEHRNGVLYNGYDYIRNAWVKDGLYVRCGHPEWVQCKCYGKTHAGQPINLDDRVTPSHLTESEKLTRVHEGLRDAIGMLSCIASGHQYSVVEYHNALESFRQIVRSVQS